MKTTTKVVKKASGWHPHAYYTSFNFMFCHSPFVASGKFKEVI